MKKLKVLYFFALIGLTSIAFGQNGTNNDYYDYLSVINFCTIELKSNENNTHLLMARGEAYFSIGDYQKSIVDFTKVIRIKPEDTLAYFSRAVVRQTTGDFLGAIKDYSKVIERSPFSFDSYIGRGHSYYQENKLKLAESDFEFAIRINPNSSIAISSRALVYIEVDKNNEAIADLNRAIEASPDVSVLYLYRGLARIKTNMLDSAIVDLEMAEKLNDKSIYFYYVYAFYFQKLGNRDRACKFYIRGKEIGAIDKIRPCIVLNCVNKKSNE